MSFKKLLLIAAESSVLTPDFTYDGSDETQGFFSFKKKTGDFIYEILFQTHRFSPEFTIELFVSRLHPQKEDLISTVKERLGKLAYKEDWWWDYDRGKPELTQQSLTRAFYSLNQQKDNFFKNAINELNLSQIEKKKLLTKRKQKDIEAGIKIEKKIWAEIERAKANPSEPTDILTALIALQEHAEEIKEKE